MCSASVNALGKLAKHGVFLSILFFDETNVSLAQFHTMVKGTIPQIVILLSDKRGVVCLACVHTVTSLTEHSK